MDGAQHESYIGKDVGKRARNNGNFDCHRLEQRLLGHSCQSSFCGKRKANRDWKTSFMQIAARRIKAKGPMSQE
jgi:hypothetical protein